jgi:hypothetical protein
MSKTLLVFFLLPVFAFAQPKYPVTDVVILRNGNPIANAWAGGFNNPVFSEIDINGDSLKDLFVYDKAGWKAMVFLNTGTIGHPSFTYAPQYERMFPTTLRDWAVMRDYNHDGVSDIFGNSIDAAINVWKGYTLNDGYLAYTQSYHDLQYTQLGGGTNSIARMWTFADNVFMDINGDGDLDILSPDINGGISLNYYQNVAVDSGYSPDSLNFILGTGCDDQNWGKFNEDVNDCGISLISCKKDLPVSEQPQNTPRDLRHQGGACCGFHYRNNSNLVSLILADILCPTTKFLENGGDTTEAAIVAYDTIFPRYDVPVYTPIAPCAFTVDANNDGFEDLLFAPFATNDIQEGQSEDVNVVLYYQNKGVDSVNLFHYVSDTMITGGVDVGSESHAVFFDYNSDGLMDIVVGNYGQFSQSGYPTSYLALYENIGTASAPKYQEANTNWNNLSSYQLNGIYPAFGDLDGDGHPDMLIGDSYGYISFFHNAGTTTASYPSMTEPDWFGINVGANAAPFIYDVNGDGLNDIVIGSKNNNIFYYWNFGTSTNPMFSPDSVNTAFGNIQVYDHTVAGPPPGYATPIISVENGQTVLYTGSQLGWIYKYAVNADSLRYGTFAMLDTSVLGTKPGLRSTISISDINNDGMNDYLTGNIRGGINLYSDANWGNVPVISSINEIAPDKAQLQIYPNPSKDNVVCRLSQGDAALVSAQLYDLLGNVISVPVSRPNNTTLTLSVSGVAEGIYVIQARDSQGMLYQDKISIFK